MGDELETPDGSEEELEDGRWSQMTAMKEILRLNRELAARLGEIDDHVVHHGDDEFEVASRLHQAGPGSRPKNAMAGSRRSPDGSELSPDELKRMVSETQGSVGVSSPPLPSLHAVAMAKAAAQKMHGTGKVEQLVPQAPLRSMPRRSMPPIAGQKTSVAPLAKQTAVEEAGDDTSNAAHIHQSSSA